MNGGAWRRLPRIFHPKEWCRKVNLAGESGAVSGFDLREFGGFFENPGKNGAAFRGWQQEDWRSQWRSQWKKAECRPNAMPLPLVSAALGVNPPEKVRFGNLVADSVRQEGWRTEGQNVEYWPNGEMPGIVPCCSSTSFSGVFSSMTPGLFGFSDVYSKRGTIGVQGLKIFSQECARGFSKTAADVNSSRGERDLPGFKVFSQNRARGFVKAAAVSPSMQKPMKLRVYMGSPGVIGEPYKKPPPSLPIWRRWLTREGWRRRKQSFMGMIKTSYTIAKLRQKTKGYSQQRFYQEASDLYKQINVALAEGEKTQLRQLVTDSIFSVMKNELKHRENSWKKVKWEMVGPIKKIRTLQGRLIGVDKNNHDNAFVQLTLKILSKQKFAAYDKRGKLVAGDPEKELLVEDYWVFEKPLMLSEAKWHLCGRLTL